MLRLLASRLLKKKLLAAWKAARKREDELEWRAKKRRQSRETRPADGNSNRAQPNEQGLRHVPALEGNPQTSRSISITDGHGKEKGLLSIFECRNSIASVHDASGNSADFRLRIDHALSSD